MKVVEITLTLMDRGFIPLLETISLTANAETMRCCVLQALQVFRDASHQRCLIAIETCAGNQPVRETASGVIS